MKTAVRIVKQNKKGRFIDTRTKKQVTKAGLLAFYETNAEEKLVILSGAAEITERVLIDALVERRHSDPELADALLFFLDGLEAA